MNPYKSLGVTGIKYPSCGVLRLLTVVQLHGYSGQVFHCFVSYVRIGLNMINIFFNINLTLSDEKKICIDESQRKCLLRIDT